MSEVTKKMIVTKHALSGGVRCGHGRVLLPDCRYFKVNGEYGLYTIGVDAFDSAWREDRTIPGDPDWMCLLLERDVIFCADKTEAAARGQKIIGAYIARDISANAAHDQLTTALGEIK